MGKLVLWFTSPKVILNSPQNISYIFGLKIFLAGQASKEQNSVVRLRNQLASLVDMVSFALCIYAQWRKVPWSQQDCCSCATQARQEKQSLQVSDSSHHPLSTLHKNLSSADWPQKPSPHPQGQTLQAPGWLDGPCQIDRRTQYSSSIYANTF